MSITFEQIQLALTDALTQAATNPQAANDLLLSVNDALTKFGFFEQMEEPNPVLFMIQKLVELQTTLEEQSIKAEVIKDLEKKRDDVSAYLKDIEETGIVPNELL